MKTKYMKVPVSVRMPKVSNTYLTNIGELKYSKIMNLFIDDLGKVKKPEYWLEEVPDLEDEYREMLEKCYQEFHKLAAKGMYPEGFLQENGGQGLSEINTLLQKTK